jgi:hypothetical protein
MNRYTDRESKRSFDQPSLEPFHYPTQAESTQPPDDSSSLAWFHKQHLALQEERTPPERKLRSGGYSAIFLMALDTESDNWECTQIRMYTDVSSTVISHSNIEHITALPLIHHPPPHPARPASLPWHIQ